MNIEMLADDARGTSHISSFFQFLVYASFFLPLGPVELSNQYNLFLKLCQYTSMVFMIVHLLYLRKRISLMPKRELLAASVFFSLFILITMFVQGGFNEGLKNLFAWPLLCLYTAVGLKNDPKPTLRCIVFLLTLVVSLDLLVSAFFFSDFYHLRFIGHVQIVFQVAILNFASTLLLVRLEGEAAPLRVYSLVVTLADCLIADAASAKVAALLFVLFLLIRQFSRRRSEKSGCIPAVDMRVALIFVLIINVVVIYLSVSRSNFLGFEWGLNARNFIWEKALEFVSESPIVGYGAQGVLLEMFWGASGNYAHSQLVQELLDGGIVLAIAFYAMLLIFVSRTNKFKDTEIRSVVKYAFISYLILMIIDSVNLYCYFYIFLPFLVMFDSVELKGAGRNVDARFASEAKK